MQRQQYNLHALADEWLNPDIHAYERRVHMCLHTKRSLAPHACAFLFSASTFGFKIRLAQKPPVLTLQSYGFTTDSIIGIFLPLYNRVMTSNGKIHYDETKTKGLRVMVNYYDETKKKGSPLVLAGSSYARRRR